VQPHHEAEDGGEVDHAHDGGDEVAEQVQVRVRDLAQDGERLPHPVDVGEPSGRENYTASHHTSHFTLHT
jgi:hypothetical protein